MNTITCDVDAGENMLHIYHDHPNGTCIALRYNADTTGNPWNVMIYPSVDALEPSFHADFDSYDKAAFFWNEKCNAK